MEKIIAQLWNGSLEPIRYFGRTNRTILALEQSLQRKLDAVEASLSDGQKEIFARYHECMEEYFQESVEQAFCDGFSLGTAIVTEALAGAQPLL